MTTLITLLLSNLNLVFFVFSFFVAALWCKVGKTDYRSELLRWILFLMGGVVGIYTFVLHVFFAQIAAANIGWQTSPFQYEVGMANLAIGVCCLFALKASYNYRLAAGITLSVWLGGDAVGHLVQMVQAHNFAPGNAGSWFWTDVLTPAVVMTLLAITKPAKK